MKPVLKLKIAVDAGMTLALLLLMAYGLVLMSLHLRIHWNQMLAIARKHVKPSRVRTWTAGIAGYLLAAYGIRAGHVFFI